MPTSPPPHVVPVFLECVRAISSGVLVRRESRRDKEFHFQDWFEGRLKETRVHYDHSGRNAYPDFVLVEFQEGYEVKGLAWPGREANFDSNSQVPSGFHNGRTVYYVFGRYPAEEEDDEYPVLDLVICHGDFLDADHGYVHENKSFRGFGSYGDILVRDRKMYVVPTPFALTDGTTGQHTLIVPADMPADPRLQVVGDLVRMEAERLVVAYAFDLRTNKMEPKYVPNPEAGKAHRFRAYRSKSAKGPPVSLKTTTVAVPKEEP